MRNNIFIKILCSIPVILIAGYFSKILCILLIIFRLIAIKDSKYTLSSALILIGLIILLPKGLDKASFDVPYLDDIITSDIYPDLLSYSKFLLILGVILLIVSYIGNAATTTISNNIGVSSYINKQEKPKSTRVVTCPHCGARNTLASGSGRCSHCRSRL